MNICLTTGSPSSKYEHRRASALLRNIQNIRICMGRKPIVSVTYENERISLKKQLTLLKMCVASLLCGPRADLCPFYGLLWKRFSLSIYKEKTVTSKFTKRFNISGRETRNSQSPHIPLFKSASGQRSFSYRTVKMDNELKLNKDVLSFKRKLKSKLLCSA